METYHMEYVPFYSALNILQMAGYLECTTDIHARSRVSFLVLRGELYRIELGSLLLERLVEYLLRHYSGIFVQYAYVDEQLMADRLGADREEVYQALLALARRKIISYIPGNDHPYILYHQARVPASYLHIGREAYEDRRESYAEKIARMAGYIEEEDTCRQLYLMRYFGQYEHRPCGMCDHCLAQKKDAGGYSREEVKQLIIDRLRTGERGVRNLIEDIDVPREQLFTCIRILLEEGKNRLPPLPSAHPRRQAARRTKRADRFLSGRAPEKGIHDYFNRPSTTFQSTTFQKFSIYLARAFCVSK